VQNTTTLTTITVSVGTADKYVCDVVAVYLSHCFLVDFLTACAWQVPLVSVRVEAGSVEHPYISLRTADVLQIVNPSKSAVCQLRVNKYCQIIAAFFYR
jgi:hypothetical protein